MATAFNDASALQHDDAIGHLCMHEAVDDDDRGPTPEHRLHSPIQNSVHATVCGRLVQHHDCRIRQQNAGKSELLDASVVEVVPEDGVQAALEFVCPASG